MIPSSAGFAITILVLFNSLPARGLDLKKKYEDQLIRWALRQKKLLREPNPKGKIIERIEIVRENVIADSDPWPKFLNLLHITTKDYVVRQEILVAPGQLWDQNKIDESARNMRKMNILAVVRAVACRSSRPGHVILLVVTKDLWSIRMNTVFAQVGTVLQTLDWTPTEENLLGRNKRISLHVGIRQLDWESFTIRDRFKLGQLYVDRRILGTRFKLIEWFDAVFSGDVPCGGAIGSKESVWCSDNSSGTLEGVYGQLQLTRPLSSLDTLWGFDLYGVVNIYHYRRYHFNSGTAPRGETAGLSLRTVTYHEDLDKPAIPRAFNIRNMELSAQVTRSFGLKTKHNLSTGLTGYSYHYEPPGNFPFKQSVLDWYSKRYLPRSEEALYTFFAYRSFSPRFVRLGNIQTFALSEDYILGHDLIIETRFALNLANAKHSYVALLMTARYRWYFLEDMLTVWITGSSRLQPGLDEMGFRELGFRGTWANNFLSMGLKNSSPPLLWGRLHLRLYLSLRDNDMNLSRTFLGGSSNIDDSGPLEEIDGQAALRGYPSDHFEGDNLFQLNLEYRSRPINILTLHLGCVVFYDGGGVFGGPDPIDPYEDLTFRYHHSVGVGIRGHFPQFDKESLRVDFAIPLTSQRGEIGTWFSFSFRQVF